MNKVNLSQAFQTVAEYWKPLVVGQVNEFQVKLAKFKGDFDWHFHGQEDELFLVVKGKLTIRMRDREVELKPGEFFIVPRGVHHQPAAEIETHVLLFEPKSTRRRGNLDA